MNIETDKLIERALADGIREGIKSKLSSHYSDNPVNKIVDAAISKHAPAFQAMLSECLTACMNNDEFRANVAESVRHTLAKTLVARFGGELEKQVNALKSDPITRSRITLAIEAIVKERSAVTV